MKDVMREVFTPLTTEQKTHAAEVKHEANRLYALLEEMTAFYPDGAKELAQARINLEQASMWAVKGVTAEVTSRDVKPVMKYMSGSTPDMDNEH